MSHYFKPVYIKETIKVSEIYDIFNNLKYKVALTSADKIDDNKYKLSYEITIVNLFSTDNPLIIDHFPHHDELPIYNYEEALKIYNKCIKRYSALVKAETKNIQDIDLFKESINYRIIQAKCCATCKFSKNLKNKHNCQHILECHNPKIQPDYAYDDLCPNEHDFEPQYYRDYSPFRGKYQVDTKIFLHPKVDQFGICDFYEPSI